MQKAREMGVHDFDPAVENAYCNWIACEPDSDFLRLWLTQKQLNTEFIDELIVMEVSRYACRF